MALPEMAGKGAGGSGSVSSRIRRVFVMILLPELAGDQVCGRPVAARASVRAPEGPLEESPESFGRLQEALWRLQRGLGRLQEVLVGFVLGCEEILR